MIPGSHAVPTAAGPVEVLATGSGSPTTLFLHGLTGTIAQTRPFGSGVAGTRVFVHQRGHGATRATGQVGYPDLARDVRAVLAAGGATRALGVSMGAGALLAALAEGAAPLERTVLCLPPPGPEDPPSPAAVRDRLAAMADALDAADVEALARLLRHHQPAAVRRLPAVTVWARRHAAELVAARAGGLSSVLRALPDTVPAVPAEGSAGALLVVAQEGDDVHPVAAARHWARLLGGRLEVLPAGSVPWRGRARLRELVAGHLNGAVPAAGGAAPGPAATPSVPG